jgi:hypothetical protein
MIENPSEGHYKELVNGSMINNCPITTSDITNAQAIFGLDLASMQDKMVRRTPVPVAVDYVAVTWSLLVERNRVITMTKDVFFVDGTTFLVTLSRNIKFVMARSIFLWGQQKPGECRNTGMPAIASLRRDAIAGIPVFLKKCMTQFDR